jgi:hypothetical protein
VTAAWGRRLASPAVALVLGALMVPLLVGALPLSLAAHQFSAGNLLGPMIAVPFAGVGVVVANRQPWNPIGWIMLILGLVVIVWLDAGFYSVLAYRVHRHDLPLSRLAVALASGWVGLIVLLPLPILLFPDGKLPIRGWRWSLWAYLALSATIVGAVGSTDIAVFTERRVTVDSSGEVASLSGSGGVAVTITVLVFLLWALISLSWVVAQLVRYRRSTGVVRQQLKWLMSGGALSVAGFVEADLLNGARSTAWSFVAAIGVAAITALPLCIGVGILKYRLFEIDVIIRKTLVYTTLIASLALVYLGGIYLTERLLQTPTGQSGALAVTLSTLAVAAAFQPLRTRIQREVDHRFYRGNYDAARTLAAFTGRLRDQIELDALSADVLTVVASTLQPSHASLWLLPTKHHPLEPGRRDTGSTRTPLTPPSTL